MLGRLMGATGVIGAVGAMLVIAGTGQVGARGGGVVLGGGSGIAIGDDVPGGLWLCTLTAVGHDRDGRAVGITAGHCGDPGDQVRAETALGAGEVGRIVDSDHYWDWAVIEFDAAKVELVRAVGPAVVAGIGAPPGPLQMVCKNGRTTGFTCGPVWENLSGGFSSHVCADYGDSGSPVLAGDRLVGMIVSGDPYILGSLTAWMPSCANPADPVHEPDLATDITAVLDDINAHNGIGAGFRPI